MIYQINSTHVYCLSSFIKPLLMYSSHWKIDKLCKFFVFLGENFEFFSENFQLFNNFINRGVANKRVLLAKNHKFVTCPTPVSIKIDIYSRVSKYKR